MSLLRELAPGAHVILGAADERLEAAAAETGVTLHEYEGDTELMLLRGPAIVEGALAAVIANTRVTIHEANVCVVGHGTIGALFARTLVLLGAQRHRRGAQSRPACRRPCSRRPGRPAHRATRARSGSRDAVLDGSAPRSSVATCSSNCRAARS